MNRNPLPTLRPEPTADTTTRLMIQIIQGKWDFNSIGNLPIAIDLFINQYRTHEVQRRKGKLNKLQNYKFKQNGHN